MCSAFSVPCNLYIPSPTPILIVIFIYYDSIFGEVVMMRPRRTQVSVRHGFGRFGPTFS